MTANRIAALSGALTGLAAFVAGAAQVLPGTWPNYALAASGLIVKLATVLSYLHGSQKFDRLEVERFLGIVKATGDVPGSTQGVKADGFQPPPDPPATEPAPAQAPPAQAVPPPTPASS